VARGRGAASSSHVGNPAKSGAVSRAESRAKGRPGLRACVTSVREADRRRRFRLGNVGDELEQCPVGVAEVHACAPPLRSASRHGPGFNANAMGFEVRDRLTDRAVPLETEVAVTGGYRYARDHRWPYARTVHVELLTADSVGDPPVDLEDISAEHVSVEVVRTLEVADRDDDVVQAPARTIRARGETDSRNSRGVERVVRQ